jgi:hypothetical protein
VSKSKPLISPVGTVSYPHLFQPFDKSGKYELILIFPPGTDTSGLEDAVEACALEKWPLKNGKSTLPKNFHNPIRDNSEREGQPGHEDGGCFVKFKSKQRPRVVDAAKNPIDSDSEKLYPGCKARVSFTPYAYDEVGNGVTMLLQNVQVTGDGERLAGSVSDPDEDFDVVEEDSAESLF